jgi:glycosyltransferase involved in cell wall biosynthesis
MNHPRVRVSIVIPAYNEEFHLPACLRAIAAQTVQPDEVIVVDNNSTDNTAAVAASYPFVTVIQEPRQGRVFARNTGFDAATSEVIGRIDADIVLPANWVEHVQRFYTEPLNQRRALSGSGYFYNVRLPRLVSWAYGVFAFRLNKLLLGHYTLWGSNMALTREQWQAVRHQVCARNDIHEDLDIAMHLHEAGFGIHYDTSVKTNAELRRVQSERHELWEYLQWWPRAVRQHGHWTWVICWLLGAVLLYWATFILFFAEKISRFFRAPPLAITAPSSRREES